jgi:hypothetical protein
VNTRRHTSTRHSHTHRYEEDSERRERFYYTMLGGGGMPPESACPDVARLVVQQHFNSPSVWCILPLQVCGACVGCVCVCVRACVRVRVCVCVCVLGVRA